MITIKQKGDFSKTEKFLERVKELFHKGILDKYGSYGVAALAAATPKDTGRTASSWDYEIVHQKGRSSIIWKNSNVNDGIPIAILIQYGHGTGNGAYVAGIDYINPAMRPVFTRIADDIWKEVKRL